MEHSSNGFKVAVLETTGKDLALEQVRFPSRLGIGQVLVKVILSGLCASQINEIDGRKGPDVFLPHGLGHEGIGTVQRVGEGVTRFSVGDDVIMHWRPSAGISTNGATIETLKGRKVNVGPVTTLAEFSIVSESRLSPLPPNIPTEIAPLLGCALLTGYGAVARDANVKSGESAMVIGFGGIGISIFKFLKAAGAHPITVVDARLEKLELAKSMGASEVVLATKDEAIETTLSKFRVTRPDVIFECTGVRSLIEGCFSTIRPDGRIVLIGVPDASSPAKVPTLALHLGVKLIGSHGGDAKPDTDIPRIARMIDAKIINLDDFPTERYPLEEINKAVNMLRQGVLGRIIIEP